MTDNKSKRELIQVVDAHTSVAKNVPRCKTVEQLRKSICEAFEIKSRDIVSLKNTNDEDVTEDMLKDKKLAIILTTSLHSTFLQFLNTNSTL
jgi:hypothetical protein